MKAVSIKPRREAKIAEEVALLEKAITGAPAGDPSTSEVRRIYAVAKMRRTKKCRPDRTGTANLR